MPALLIQNGLGSERIIALRYGEAYPVVSNHAEAGRQQNRRVEIVILKEGESAAGFRVLANSHGAPVRLLSATTTRASNSSTVSA